MSFIVCKCYRSKVFLFCIVIIFPLGCLVSLWSMPGADPNICKCKVPDDMHLPSTSAHILGVLVPFRDRFEELLEFLPHMTSFLTNQNITFKIYVMNQVDSYRFNRASLINVGFKEAVSEGCDYIAMHDVDLLPINPSLSYAYPVSGIYHVASPELHPRYHYESFLGGILIIKKEDFVKVNGMSNKYWGWGLEDDEFYVRIKSAQIPVNRPTNLTTDSTNTFRHIHERGKRRRDTSKCYDQRDKTRRRDRVTGLNSVSYSVDSRRELVVDKTARAIVINTRLNCNHTLTPWCTCHAAPP